MCRDDTSSYWYISGAFCLVSRGWFELLYSVFNECSEELIVKSNFMFFFLYCVVFLLGSICFLSLSFCQNVRFRPLCLPYSSVVPALMDFIRFSRGVGFTVLPGWGRLLLSFCRVRGSGVRRRASGMSGNGAFGCLMVIQDVPRFSFR